MVIENLRVADESFHVPTQENAEPLHTIQRDRNTSSTSLSHNEPDLGGGKGASTLRPGCDPELLSCNQNKGAPPPHSTHGSTPHPTPATKLDPRIPST